MWFKKERLNVHWIYVSRPLKYEQSAGILWIFSKILINYKKTIIKNENNKND